MDVWVWVWVILAAALIVGEIFTAGFFLLPFGIGAIVAGVLAFLNAALGWQWLAFVVVSAAALFGLRRFADRVTHEPPEKVGIDRLLGKRGTVIETIEASGVGRVRIDREEWRAEAADGRALQSGTAVDVEKVVGTRVIVRASESKEE